MLDYLKEKWFIDFNDAESFPPQHRASNSKIEDSTDGNSAKLLIDGATLMEEFHNHLKIVEESDTPSEYTVWISAMNINSVKLLGENDTNPDIKERLINLANLGANVRYLGSGHAGADRVAKSLGKELIKAGSFGTADKRFPKYGGQHQKFTLVQGPDNSWMTTFGSADFFNSNWDTSSHQDKNPDRPKGNPPVHNLSLKLSGPIVHELALSFAERWNDIETSEYTEPRITEKVSTDFANNPLDRAGTLSVQLLRNYAISDKSYSWANKGEFTIWASYMNAIKKAEKYIYIEDQYFFPFGSPPFITSVDATKNEKESDIFYQLGEAIKRGVDVIALVPGRNNAWYKYYEIAQRRLGADYLKKISEENESHGRFIMSKLQAEKIDVRVHSKVMLVDDELSLIGSNNICQRSMALCSEIHLAIIDEENKFTQNLRAELWQEHLGLNEKESLYDLDSSITRFIKDSNNSANRLHTLDTSYMKYEKIFRWAMRKFIEPYEGPDRA